MVRNSPSLSPLKVGRPIHCKQTRTSIDRQYTNSLMHYILVRITVHPKQHLTSVMFSI